MSELTTKTIKEQLGRYLSGDLQPEEFRDWFALVLRDVHKVNEPDADELVHSIEWAFYDLERGIPSEDVRKNLSFLASDTKQTVVFLPPLVLGSQIQDSSVSISSGTSSLAAWLGGAASFGLSRISHYPSGYSAANHFSRNYLTMKVI